MERYHENKNDYYIFKCLPPTQFIYSLLCDVV